MGRIARSVTTRESEWDEHEQDLMLALAAYRTTLCPLCGRPLEVCTDPANEMRWRAGLPTRCFPTTAILNAQEPYSDKKASGALLFDAELTTS